MRTPRRGEEGEPREPAAHCCAPPARATGPSVTAHDGLGPAEVSRDHAHPALPAHDDVAIPAGAFRMGDPFDEGYPADGEGPVHEVELSAFRIDATAVTNATFARFVAATGYVTEAERFGSSAVFHLLVAAEPEEYVQRVSGTSWWVEVRGADWAHPQGSRSSWEEVAEHPVVHVSHTDTLAFCRWAGRRLPTEAEWERAARGDHEGRRFPWGDELEPAGEHRMNIWQGVFPEANTLADGFLGTAPVRSFPPNALGLFETSGNVWEWCADWFSPGYYGSSPREDPRGPALGWGRVMRGGSYLCHDSYCHRYRVAARSQNSPDSSSGNLGFRTVAL